MKDDNQPIVIVDGDTLQTSNDSESGPGSESKSQQRKITRPTRILELESHHNFAHALRRGLEEVKSEYVLVVQHDRAFSTKFDIRPALNVFRRKDEIGQQCRYIGFQSRSNVGYAEKLLCKYGKWCYPYTNEFLNDCYEDDFMWGDLGDNDESHNNSNLLLENQVSQIDDPESKSCQIQTSSLSEEGQDSSQLSDSTRASSPQYSNDCRRSNGKTKKSPNVVVKDVKKEFPGGSKLKDTKSSYQCESEGTVVTNDSYQDSRKNDNQTKLPRNLIPLFFWYDSSHICRTQEYIKLIREECKKGQFIESTYGHRIEHEIVRLYSPQKRYKMLMENAVPQIFEGNDSEECNKDDGSFDKENMIESENLISSSATDSSKTKKQQQPGQNLPRSDSESSSINYKSNNNSHRSSQILNTWHVQKPTDPLKNLNQFQRPTQPRFNMNQISRELAKREELMETWSPLVHLREYGMFLWHDPLIGESEPMVVHLHGRVFWTPEQRVRNGWPAYREGGREEFVRKTNGRTVYDPENTEDIEEPVMMSNNANLPMCQSEKRNQKFIMNHVGNSIRRARKEAANNNQTNLNNIDKKKKSSSESDLQDHDDLNGLCTEFDSNLNWDENSENVDGDGS